MLQRSLLVMKLEAGATRGVLLCIALLFSLPFVLPVHRPPLPGFDAEWLAAVLLAITVTLAGVAGGGKTPMQWPLPAFVFGLVAIGAVHWMLRRLDYPYGLTQPRDRSDRTAGVLLCRPLARHARPQADRHRGSLRWAGCRRAVFGPGAMPSAHGSRGIAPALFLEHSRSTTSQPFGDIGQPNQLAAYLAMGVVAVGFLRTSRLSRAVSAGIQAVLAAGIAVSASRMGLLMVVLLAAARLFIAGSFAIGR